jgi:hypothetical protein
MNHRLNLMPRWSTSAFIDTSENLSTELNALREHLNLCNRLRGRMFALRCAAESTNRFVAARFVSTLVVLGLLISISLLVL